MTPVKTHPKDIKHDTTLRDGSEYKHLEVPDNFDWRRSPKGNKVGPVYD